MNRNYIKREWGAVAFVVTAILGGLAVMVALLIKAISPTAIPAAPPCPKTTPVVIQAQASASPTPSISIKTVPFGCPTPQVIVQTPTPSPTATATPKASASASPSS